MVYYNNMFPGSGKAWLENVYKITLPKSLKTLDTNWQLSKTSLHSWCIATYATNLWKFELNRSSKLRDNNKRKKHPCQTKLCAFRCLILRPKILNLRSRNQILGKLLLSSKTTWLQRELFLTMFYIYYQPQHITRYQERFYANNYFE